MPVEHREMDHLWNKHYKIKIIKIVNKKARPKKFSEGALVLCQTNVPPKNHENGKLAIM